ncbi:MAG: hypothetical protein IAG10_23285 [Planctomycetaceae bacterium]|nr:hypothetical protein [Planctomycetaceae bacterium]
MRSRDDGQGGKRTDGFELLEPHFWITVALDESNTDAPLAGETGLLRLGQRRTCGEELLNCLTRKFGQLGRDPSVR